MKKACYFIGLFLFLPALCLASFSFSQWKYYKNINGANAPLTKFDLDDEIFSGAKKNLSDLRIIDANNREVPFKITSKAASIDSQLYPVKILNNSAVPGQYSSLILDTEGKGYIINNLNILTDSENFQRNVKVFGSDDMVSWNLLKADAYIYDYTDRKGNFKSQNTAVSFPDSAFRYLKVEISDEEGSPVRVKAVSARQLTASKGKEMERRPGFNSSENSQRRATEVIIDFKQEGVPVAKIALKTASENFKRGVLVYSGNNAKDWRFLGQGYVFRYKTAKFSGENLVLNFPETNDRYVKLEIINKDNAPLPVSDLVAFSVFREVAFPAEKNNSYRIFYGNDKASYPEYDLESYFKYLDLGGATAANLSSQKNNPEFVPEKEPQKPVSERVPYLFTIVLVLTSAMLLLLVYKFLKK